MVQELEPFLEGKTLLRRLPTLAEGANVAAFVASDRAGTLAYAAGGTFQS